MFFLFLCCLSPSQAPVMPTSLQEAVGLVEVSIARALLHFEFLALTCPLSEAVVDARYHLPPFHSHIVEAHWFASQGTPKL